MELEVTDRIEIALQESQLTQLGISLEQVQEVHWACAQRWSSALAGSCSPSFLHYGFQYVDRTFFPDSARLQVMLEYWAPQGTKIQTVSSDLGKVEQRLLEDLKVASVSTFMGQGPPRFTYLLILILLPVLDAWFYRIPVSVQAEGH